MTGPVPRTGLSSLEQVFKHPSLLSYILISALANFNSTIDLRYKEATHTKMSYRPQHRRVNFCDNESVIPDYDINSSIVSYERRSPPGYYDQLQQGSVGGVGGVGGGRVLRKRVREERTIWRYR
jgi:hypothetical protein